jgi:hypothetical protein
VQWRSEVSHFLVLVWQSGRISHGVSVVRVQMDKE